MGTGESLQEGRVSGVVSSLPGQLPQLSARCAWPGCQALAGAVRRIFHSQGLVCWDGSSSAGLAQSRWPRAAPGWHHPLTGSNSPLESHMRGMLSPSPSGCPSPTSRCSCALKNCWLHEGQARGCSGCGFQPGTSPVPGLPALANLAELLPALGTT